MKYIFPKLPPCASSWPSASDTPPMKFQGSSAEHSFGSEDWLGISIPSSSVIYLLPKEPTKPQNTQTNKNAVIEYKIPFIASQNSQWVLWSQFKRLYMVISRCFHKIHLFIPCGSLPVHTRPTLHSAAKATNTIWQKCLARALCILVALRVVSATDIYPCIHDIKVMCIVFTYLFGYNCIKFT